MSLNKQPDPQSSLNILNLKPYQPFGIPLLAILFGLALFSLALTALYEIIF
ncbi:MAG: hypothetical protein JSS07_07180 [Proteobacteria bacterium]|nr:hypothetical protein [Pseudomonadota bacterium]